MAFLDPEKFSLGTEPDMRSFQDRMLELRRGLPPDVQAMQPPLPGMPQQTRQEQQEQDLGKQINQAAQMLSQQAAAAQTPPGAKPNAKAANVVMDEMNGLLDQVNPFKPKQSIGTPAIGQFLTGEDRGGLFGTGIQPIDVLAFAIGAGITSNLPQDKAIATTFQIAQLPGQLRDSQLKNAKDFIATKLQAIGAGTAATNAETSAANSRIAQTQAAQAEQQYGSRLQLANAYRMAGRGADALAIEANAVAEHVKLTGGLAEDKLPPQMEQWLSGIISGVIPEQRIPKQLRDIGITDAGQARVWYDQFLRSKPVTVTPEGIPLQRTTQGTAALTSPDQLAPPLGRGGAPSAAPMAAPGVPATSMPTAPVAALPTAPVAQLPEQVKPWLENMPTTTQTLAQPLFARGVDESTAAKMLAGHGTAEFAKSLYQKYEAMIDSYGGDKGYSAEISAKLYAITMAATLSGEGITGAVFTQLGQGISALAQRYGVKLTPQAEEFIAEMAQAQGFAKGSLQDAANIAVRERQFFFGMIGSTLDVPSIARKKFERFYNTAQNNYNGALALAARRGKNVVGFEPMPRTLREALGDQGPLTPRGQLQQQPGQLPPGWEFIAPPSAPRVSGEY